VGYQSSIDSLLSAGAFALFGATPVVLISVPVVLHAFLTLIAFGVLRRRLDARLAVVGVLPLVFAPVALTWPILAANRQACIAMFFIAVWLLDGAAESKRSTLRYAAGALLAALLPLVDLYAVLLLPGLLVLLVCCVLDGTSCRSTWTRRALACAVGIAIGVAGFVISRSDRQSSTGQAGLSLARTSLNASLLWDQCLPYSLGYAQYREGEVRYRGTLAPAAMPWRALLTAGGWSLLAGIAAGGALSFSRLPWQLRRLGLFGLTTTVATAAAFILSVMPGDLWAIRYLGPIFWTAPFALAPLARWLGRVNFAIALAPWLIVSTISGWQSYGSAFTPADALEEQQLIDYLRANHIRCAAADYWLAYRLTFVSHEDVIVVPIDPLEDRYKPYRQQFLKESKTALIFHPRWSREQRDAVEQSLKEQRISFQPARVGEFVLLIVNRAV
jgi:hypothetical protein